MTCHHVFAVPTHETCMDPGIHVGHAKTTEEAIALVEASGYTVIPEPGGGSYDHYDAEDGPNIYGYEADGLGAFSITVEPS